MTLKLTRRHFLGAAAAAGTSTLLPATALPASVKARTANPALARAPVAKIMAQAEPFAMTEVRLLPSFWKDMAELNRSYLYSLPNERLAHNFRVTAGLPSDPDPLGGWEAPDCELRGHYIGHYLSACAFVYASTGDQVIAAKASDLVATLAQCQAKDGYLGTYPTSFYERLRTHQKVWAPFYTYHKILAGMIDLYEHTGNQQALDVALKMADWADAYSRPISADEWQKILLIEHGGMNEAAFNLYAITANPKYRDLALRFEHKKFFDPLAANQDMLNGNHANTNIPKIIGAIRGYQLTGDPRYKSIAQNFYRIVTEHHTYCTGGTSNNEGWHEPDGIASQLGPSAEECCCSYNMLKLTRHLFGQQPDPRFFDFYERTLLNMRYGTQDRNGMLMYYVSLRPGLYKTFGTQFDAFWCCTGTGSEEYAKLNDSVYFHDDTSVYINLFIPSRLDWKERGLKLSQTTKYPNESRITFTIDAAPAKPTTLKLRIPYWATQGATVTLNGQFTNVTAAPSTYLALDHPWKTGDILTLDIPMTLHIDQAPDDKQVQAAMYGPIVLAVRQGTEGLTNTMIYAGSAPRAGDDGYPMPSVNNHMAAQSRFGGAPATPDPIADNGLWFEQVEGSRHFPLQFRSKGRGPIHSLVPLNQIMDERYSVYVRNESKA